MDITHDPGHGLDARKLAEALVASRDTRIKYIISNSQIISSTVSPWVWRSYSGANAHRQHCHISVGPEQGMYDDPRSWSFQMEPVAPVVADLKSGKGSWYSQHSGKYEWIDTGDEPGSAALGVPDNAQGVSFYDHDTLGKWFEVHYPNGFISIEQQTDIGPHPNTGRLIDISAVAAERAGYSPDNIRKSPNPYPTDAIIYWRQISAPSAVAGLSPQQQAVQYRDLRSEIKVPEPQILPPINTELKKIWDQLAPQLMPIIAQVLQTVMQDALQRVLAKQPPILLPKPTDPTPVTPPPTVGSAIGFLARAAVKILPMLGLQGTVWGTVALWIAQANDVIGTAGGATATPTGGALSAGLAGAGLSSIVALIGRFLNKKPATSTQ